MKKKSSKSGLSARNKKRNNHKKTKKVNNPDTSKIGENGPKSVKNNIHQIYKRVPTEKELEKARKNILERFKKGRNSGKANQRTEDKNTE